MKSEAVCAPRRTGSKARGRVLVEAEGVLQLTWGRDLLQRDARTRRIALERVLHPLALVMSGILSGLQIDVRRRPFAHDPRHYAVFELCLSLLKLLRFSAQPNFKISVGVRPCMRASRNGVSGAPFSSPTVHHSHLTQSSLNSPHELVNERLLRR